MPHAADPTTRPGPIGSNAIGDAAPRWIVAPPHLPGDGTLRVAVTRPEGRRFLTFDVGEAYAASLSSRADAALLALLMPAMAAGAHLIVEGEVSPRIAYHAAGPLQALVRTRVPTLPIVPLTLPAIAPRGVPATGVGLGFSAGVDSWHALLRHAGPATDAFAVTHLTFHDVGADDGVEALFMARRERVAAIAERVALPLVVVRSNLAEWYAGDRRIDFERSDAIRNAAVAHALTGALGRFLYASAHPYAVTNPLHAHSARSEALTVPMLASDLLDTVSVGGDTPRLRKLAAIAEVPLTHGTLDVCANARHVAGARINCSRCNKCLRAQASLEVQGLLDRYAGVFDLEAYARRRVAFLAEVLAIDGPHYREIRRVAAERGYRMPSGARVRAALREPQMRAFALKVRRRLRTAGAA